MQGACRDRDEVCRLWCATPQGAVWLCIGLGAELQAQLLSRTRHSDGAGEGRGCLCACSWAGPQLQHPAVSGVMEEAAGSSAHQLIHLGNKNRGACFSPVPAGGCRGTAALQDQTHSYWYFLLSVSLMPGEISELCLSPAT